MAFETKIQEVMQAIENGQVSEGLQILNSLEQEANDEEQLQIAELYQQLGHVQKAREIIESLLERYPDEEELILAYAELLMNTDEHESAIEWLEDIDEMSANRPRALLLLADIYMTEGLDEVAENKLLEALRLLPEEPVVEFALAEFYFNLGNYQKSRGYYEILLKQQHELPLEDIYAHYAETLSVAGSFEQSLIYYEKGLENSHDSDRLFSFALTAYRAGSFMKAIHVLERIKQEDPEYGKLYLYLAKAYMGEGMPEQAYKAAEEGMKIDSFDVELAYQTADMAKQRAEFPTAEQWLETALGIDALHHESLLALIELYYQQERYPEIIDRLKNIEDSEEKDARFIWYLATSHNQQEVFGDALSYYEQAEPFFEDDPLFLEDFADFLIEEGRQQKAVQLFKKAVALDPSNPALQEKLLHFESSYE